MVATVVDSITHLTRVLINVNSEQPNTDPLLLMPRPYETAVDVEPVRPNTISLAEFGDLLKETT